MIQYHFNIKNMQYSEKLKDPRWKDKRMFILDRDGYQCKRCKQYSNKGHELVYGHKYPCEDFKYREEDLELHVHHIKYKGEPWEANDKDLITLCEMCHVTVEYFKSNGYNMSLDEITFKVRTESQEYYLASRGL